MYPKHKLHKFNGNFEKYEGGTEASGDDVYHVVFFNK
jgi:hypothetical protein